MVYVAYTAMLSGPDAFEHYALTNLVTVPIYMVAYYLLRYVQLPLFYEKGRFVLFVGSMLLSAAALCLLHSLAWKLWLGQATGNIGRVPLFEWNSYVLKSVRFYSPAMALILIELIVSRKNKRLKIDRLENEKMKNELNYLKASINPQFISTTLNTLHKHVVVQSPEAPEMILGMSNLLDYALYKSQKPNVELKEEIAAIEQLIKLEQVRLGEGTEIRLETEGSNEVEVPPLLLFAIVDYVFKQEKEMAASKFNIKICSNKSTGKLELTIEYENSTNSTNSISAIENWNISKIRRRLALLYPERHRIIRKKVKHGYLISVEIGK